MGKFGLVYELSIGPTYALNSQFGEPPTLVDATILTIPAKLTTIPIPLSLEFDIERHNLSNSGHFNIRVYGLGLTNRMYCRKDYNQTFLYKRVELKAGYGNVLATIARGNLNRGYSWVGNQGWVTQLEGFDGGFDYLNTSFNQSFGSGTSQEAILTSLIKSLNFVRQGVVGPAAVSANALGKGEAYSGPVLEILRDTTGGAAFIDLETLHILADSEAIEGPLLTINSQSGLLGTPMWQDAFLTVDMIFEPRIVVGQKVVVDSLSEVKENFNQQVNRTINGPWKVVGIKHHGIISDTVAGDQITSLSLSQNGAPFTLVGAA